MCTSSVHIAKTSSSWPQYFGNVPSQCPYYHVLLNFTHMVQIPGMYPVYINLCIISFVMDVLSGSSFPPNVL